jgi:hypothetical protein
MKVADEEAIRSPRPRSAYPIYKEPSDEGISAIDIDSLPPGEGYDASWTLSMDVTWQLDPKTGKYHVPPDEFIELPPISVQRRLVPVFQINIWLGNSVRRAMEQVVGLHTSEHVLRCVCTKVYSLFNAIPLYNLYLLVIGHSRKPWRSLCPRSHHVGHK